MYPVVVIDHHSGTYTRFPHPHHKHIKTKFSAPEPLNAEAVEALRAGDTAYFDMDPEAA